MIKRLLLCLLAGCMLLCAGCKKQEYPELSEGTIIVTPTGIDVPEVFYPNPLTGIKELKEDDQNKRPIAVMINNISVAQEVQCGLNDADLVFECLVEGGISRLMAVYYNVEPVKQIGSIRSARYTYAELCNWLDAVYVHHGSDTRYAIPYMKEIDLDHYEVNNTSGFRAENGLSWEHRLYTDGEKLTKALKDGKFRLTNEEPTKAIFTFGDAASPITPATPCDSITYAMSPSNKTTFTYNPQTQKYVRSPGGNVHKDYRTKEETVTDNVIILYANSPHFEDNYHVKTVLSSGKGVYVSKGGSQTIRWKKNGDTNDLVLLDEYGSPLTINPGSSWIAFPPSSGKEATKVESKPETKTSTQ